MKTLILGDIHNYTWIADDVVRHFQEEIDEVVYVGDYFDNWYDTVEDAKKTAYWLKKTLHSANVTCIIGNHDYPYMFPKNQQLSCPGWTPEKSKAVNEIITKDEWSKFKLAYKTQGFWISHAGITDYHFSHPVYGITDEYIKEVCDRAMQCAESRIYNGVLSAGYMRGGSVPIGGITWADWEEVKALKNIRQIIGHSPHRKYRSKYIPNKKNKEGEIHCIDCFGKYFGLIENEVFKLIEKTETGYVVKDV